MALRIVFNILLLLVASTALHEPRPVHTQDSSVSLESFGRLLRSLSEPEGYFDSDNFVSNEGGYLQVLPSLKRLGVRGGAYIGVGPDQNYSYIAAIRPRMAIILDIRQQNAAQHLYYKALFQLSRDRVEFLERLFGRSTSARFKKPGRAQISEILDGIEHAEKDPVFTRRAISEAKDAIRSWKIGLNEKELDTVEYVARAFIEGGPNLKFTSYNRGPRPHHPTYRDLLEARDGGGSQLNYLAAEERFRTIQELHRENRILPVVGDFAGESAFQNISRELRRRGLEVKCFYASNVEFYLFRSDRWQAYVRNLESLPLAQESYIIRSYANMWQHYPAERPGHYMATVLQSLHVFLANERSGKTGNYRELVTRDLTP